MIYFLLFLIELYLLWNVSRQVNSHFYNKLPFWVYIVFFLPGTFIHELSHFIVAKLLLVPVGKFNLRPKKLEKEIILGSVAIAKVDNLRRLLIGIAPLIIGIGLILATVYFSVSNGWYHNWVVDIFVIYLIFVLGNSMFSSKKDLEGAWKVLLVILIITAAAIILKLKINIEISFDVLQKIDLYLLAPIVIDLLAILPFSGRTNKLS